MTSIRNLHLQPLSFGSDLAVMEPGASDQVEGMVKGLWRNLADLTLCDSHVYIHKHTHGVRVE